MRICLNGFRLLENVNNFCILNFLIFLIFIMLLLNKLRFKKKDCVNFFFLIELKFGVRLIYVIFFVFVLRIDCCYG